MRTIRHVTLCLLLASWAVAAPARPIRFDRLSVEQGLSQSTVTCIFQDSRGYVWLGTEDGLNRFDGYTFKVYKRDRADPSSLPNSFIWAIDEDPQGNLWIGTEGGGVVVWDRVKDRFIPQTAVRYRLVRSLRFGPKGILWIGTRQEGLLRLDVAKGTVTRFAHDASDPTSLSDDRIFALHVDRQGRLWVGTDHGLNRLEADGKRFVRFENKPSPPAGLGEGRIRSIFEDKHGSIWVGTYGIGLYRLDPETGLIEGYRHDPAKPSSLSHDQVRAIFQDSEGGLWVGTSEGLDLFEPRRQAFLHYRYDRGDPASLADNNVMSIMQDLGGVLWVGTRLGGVHKWNPLSWQFGHVAPDAEDSGGLVNGKVTSFSEDSAGRLWIGTFGGGLHVLSRATGEIKRYHNDPRNPGSLSSDQVTALLHDQRAVLWVGTMDGGLNRFDAAKGAFKRYVSDPQRTGTLAANGVTSLWEDRDGKLWVGTFGGGLNLFEPDAERFTTLKNDPKDAASLSGNRISTIVEAPQGRLWVGTFGGGLNLFDPASGRAQRFEHNPEDPSSLPSDSVHALLVDAADGLWVGTPNGLSYLTAGSQSFETFTKKDGLPNDVIYAIRTDRQGRLWLSTNNGLSSFDPRTRAFRNFGVSHGLQASEFNFGASFQSARGELFFGGVNGFNAFLTDRLRRVERVPPVVLTSVMKGHRPLEMPADQVHRLDLGFRDDVITFEFAALDFTAPNRNRFSYKLEGFDPEWVVLEGAHRVTYTNLDAGRYALRVRAANSDGVWNEEGVNVQLNVAAPPWATPWAYAAYILIAGVSLGGIFEVNRRKLRREAEYARLLELRVEERTRELAERQTELESVNRELAQASITDSLTGLANRRFLREYLEKEVALIHRGYHTPEGAPPETLGMAFVMIDLDNFKQINDTVGHAAGDAVLRQLRDILKAACRRSDVIVRWGGDEFLVIARGMNRDQLGSLAERIRSRIAEHVFDVGDGQTTRSSCSVGFACYPFIRESLDALTWEQVVSVADRALYVAKANGRNAWVGLHSTETTPETAETGLFSLISDGLADLVHEGKLSVSTSVAGPKLAWG